MAGGCGSWCAAPWPPFQAALRLWWGAALPLEASPVDTASAESCRLPERPPSPPSSWLSPRLGASLSALLTMLAASATFRPLHKK